MPVEAKPFGDVYAYYFVVSDSGRVNTDHFPIFSGVFLPPALVI